MARFCARHWRCPWSLGNLSGWSISYGDAAAYAAGVTFGDWTDAIPLEEQVAAVAKVALYQSGQFFRRELPCLLAVLRVLPPVDAVIVDGYVWLSAGNHPGLGAHLYQALGEHTAVVGVAKTRFKGADFAREVVRGRSTRPLFIMAAGMSPECAAEHVRSMHGPYRMPALLKGVASQCRNAQAMVTRNDYEQFNY